MGPFENEYFPYYFILLGAIALFQLYIMFGRREARFKRKWFPKTIIAFGLVFVLMIYNPEMPVGMFLFILLAVSVVTFAHIKLTKFCDGCGKTVRSQNPFSPAKFCPKCGANLEENKQPYS